MEKLLSLLNNNVDKVTHCLVGYLISTASPVPSYGVMASVVLGALKEYYDYQHSTSHTCDFYDFLVTSLGGALGYIVITLIH